MTRGDAWSIHVADEVPSTNDAVLQLPWKPDEVGVVLFAERQTAGRGRRGNAWFGGPSGANLLFSCAVRPQLPVVHWSRLTHGTALALKRVLESYPTLKPLVKWPNDIYLKERKVAGILVETETRDDATGVAVIGVGLNVNGAEEDLPPEIRSQATSLRAETATWVDREGLAGALLDALTQVLTELPQAFGEVLEEVKASHYLLHRTVRARLGEGCVEGRVIDLGPEGELILEGDGGRRQVVTSADEVRPIDQST
jgi:BirA family biotin operon repressor/biotin-[acetyl-CoA-carboxylase] ligase